MACGGIFYKNVMITKSLYGCGSLELFFFPAPFSRRESTNSSGCLTGHISIERATLDYFHQKANSNMYHMEQIFASKRVALFVRVLRPIFFPLHLWMVAFHVISWKGAPLHIAYRIGRQYFESEAVWESVGGNTFSAWGQGRPTTRLHPLFVVFFRNFACYEIICKVFEVADPYVKRTRICHTTSFMSMGSEHGVGERPAPSLIVHRWSCNQWTCVLHVAAQNLWCIFMVRWVGWKFTRAFKK